MAMIGDEEEMDMNLQVGELTYEQLKRFLIATFKEAVTIACKNLSKDSQELQTDVENEKKEDWEQFILLPEEQQNNGQERELVGKKPLTIQNTEQEKKTRRGQHVKKLTGLKLKMRTRKGFFAAFSVKRKQKVKQGKKLRKFGRNSKKYKSGTTYSWAIYLWKQERKRWVLRSQEYKNYRHKKEIQEKKLITERWEKLLD
ncbi:UNVERIFIED_CONTAM: hypothetical protein K2H54_064675, partial [Gekko kuhli]